MPKDKPSIREHRRKPMMTLKGKRAMKRAKRHLFSDTAEIDVKL